METHDRFDDCGTVFAQIQGQRLFRKCLQNYHTLRALSEPEATEVEVVEVLQKY